MNTLDPRPMNLRRPDDAEEVRAECLDKTFVEDNPEETADEFVAVRIVDDDDDDYLYITTRSRNELLSVGFTTLYRFCREVETLIREFKTRYELVKFDTSNADVVKIIILYAALLSPLVTRDLLNLVTEQTDGEIIFLPERWAATFRSHVQLSFYELGEYLGYSPSTLLERLF
ncbi:hypothetical protein EGH23_19395 [Halomicroarcula sp. F27]|uniref:Uncharacterized protein n=1 Tax=Haloarcula nitratireducens TaxID=2487749 RepID=A0AAW4PG29_9EURY|nr:hypothetical protein [Halomicroarcula nitratireducens]